MALRIAVLVPCYNAARWIPDLVERITPFVPADDIYLVDDGSIDGTRAAIVESGANLIAHELNKGKGEALRTGFAAILNAGYDGLITLDADLQHLPEHLPAFIEAAPNYDLVVGTRAYHLRNMPIHRWATNHTTSKVVSWLAGVPIHDSQSGYRYLAARVVRDVPLSTVKYDMESEQLIRAARMRMTIGEVPIDTVYGESASYIHPVADTLRFIRMVWRNLFWKPEGTRA